MDFTDIRYIRDIASDALAQYSLCGGDLLFTRYNGSLDLTAVCGVVDGPPKPLLYPDKLIRVRVDAATIDPCYVQTYFSSPFARRLLRGIIKSTAGQNGVSGRDLRAIPIAVAPFREQQEIVRLTEGHLGSTAYTERGVAGELARAQSLRQATLQRAFNGTLVPQDPTDEPASALLSRIADEKAEAAPKPRGRKRKASQERRL